MTFEPHFDNRDENGLETNIDGYETQYDKEPTLQEYNKHYIPKNFTSEALEHEEIIDDQI